MAAAKASGGTTRSTPKVYPVLRGTLSSAGACSMSDVLTNLLDRLHGPRRNGSGWMARCPAHDDKNPSLSINEREGKILLHCHAGCSFENVIAAVGVEATALFSDAPVHPR